MSQLPPPEIYTQLAARPWHCEITTEGDDRILSFQFPKSAPVVLRLSQNALEKFVSDLQQTLTAQDAS